MTSSKEISGAVDYGQWKFRVRSTFKFCYVDRDDGDGDEDDDD
jgi:hypothetical protein